MKVGRFSADERYRWVVAFAATVVVFFQTGLANVIGVFVPDFEEHLRISALTVGWCTSVGIGLRAILGPVWSALAKNISCRKLVMTGGVTSCIGIILVGFSKSAVHLGLGMALLSIGSGIPSVTKITHLQKYFYKSFNKAVSVVFAGGTISLFVLAPVIEYLIIYVGWRGAMLIYGAFNLNICVAGALLTEPRAFVDKGLEENIDKSISHQAIETSSLLNEGGNSTYRNIFSYLADLYGFSIISQHRVLVRYLLAMSLHELVFSGWSVFLVSYTITNGYNAESGSLLVAVGGAGAVAGRLVLGPVMDNKHISGLRVFSVLAFGGAVSLACYSLINDFVALSGVSFAGGLCLGSTVPVYFVILKDIFPEDTEGFAAAIGLQYMCRGIGMLAGGPLTGLLSDTTGSLKFSFTALGVLEGAVAVITITKVP